MTKSKLHFAMSYYLQLWQRSLLQKSWQLINYLTEEHLCYNKTAITPPLQQEKKMNRPFTYCVQSTAAETQASKSQVSSMVGFLWAGGNGCLLQRKAARPGLLLSCPLPSPFKSFSATSLIRVSFCFPVVGGCWGEQWFLSQFCHF